MAQLMLPSGRTRIVHPENGSRFTRAELAELVGGPIHVTRTIDGEVMVINDMGKLLLKPAEDHLNYQATRLYIHGRKDVILGPAVVVSTIEEIDGPGGADGGSSRVERLRATDGCLVR